MKSHTFCHSTEQISCLHNFLQVALNYEEQGESVLWSGIRNKIQPFLLDSHFLFKCQVLMDNLPTKNPESEYTGMKSNVPQVTWAGIALERDCLPL